MSRREANEAEVKVSSKQPSDIPWQVWLRLAVVEFRLRPQDFWSLSVWEWQMMLAGFSQIPDAMGQRRFQELQDQFPDIEQF